MNKIAASKLRWREFHIDNMATFINQSKNTTSWSNVSKNTATFKNILKHGNANLLSDLANFTFEDVIFTDGTKLKDVSFADLTQQVWTNITKN